MSKYQIAFTCSHKVKNQKQLEEYADSISKKNEDIHSLFTLEYGVASIKIITNKFNDSFKTVLTSLRDDGFIINPNSIFELHRVYEISKLDDLKRIMVGVLRSQTQMHLTNRNYYNSYCRMYDSKILSELQSSQTIEEFCQTYLNQIVKNPISDEEGIKKFLKNKNIIHPSWCDLIPLLRSYYKIDYESIDEANVGLGTFFIRLKMLHKDKDIMSIDLDVVKKSLTMLLANMNYIMS